jgi:hypothetical protein
MRLSSCTINSWSEQAEALTDLLAARRRRFRSTRSRRPRKAFEMLGESRSHVLDMALASALVVPHLNAVLRDRKAAAVA